jgi:hypothetical protein
MSALLPLFPLHTVLVPGGTLVLRVFETRYLDMVRECGRNGSGFGVCLILAGQEAGLPATPASVGTEARIEDFGSTEAGLLTLRVRGGRRFRVLQTEVRPNGLIEAEVQWFGGSSYGAHATNRVASAINAEGAWNVTRGSSSVVVAGRLTSITSP